MEGQIAALPAGIGSENNEKVRFNWVVDSGSETGMTIFFINDF